MLRPAQQASDAAEFAFPFDRLGTPLGNVMNRPEIVTYLAEHHWVASVEQLRELEVTKSALEHARRKGTVLSPVPGVVVAPGVKLSLEGRALLAQLAAGKEAFVSGPTAGAIRGLRSMPTTTIEITIKERRLVTLPDGSRFVRTSWIDEERDVEVREDGIRLASPLRMLFGLAAQFNQHRFERTAEDVWHKGLVTPEQASDYLQAIRRSGRTGVKRMNTWLEKTSMRERPAHSGLELDLIDIVARAELPTPVRQHPLKLLSGETIHLDIAWPDIRLAAEPGHSWWHGGDLGQRRDQGRDRACGAVGWLVLRYDEDAARRPKATAAELREIHRRRSAEFQAR
jgi:hypothetical protein